MEQQQERSNVRLHEMDQELNQGKFDRNRIARQSREIEQAMNEWRNQYRKMSQEMGVKP
jgi:predicted  nucleic acid-binding Zn-ribbon protein